MAKFTVRVRYEMEREMTIFARDDMEAEEKAVDIVEGWKDVRTAEAVEVEEE
jgi:hypothetical protein